MSINKSEISVSLGQLLLDPNNYRLNTGQDPVDYTFDEIVSLQDETLQKLVSKNLSELESSIRLNGFLEVDKIVVRKLTSGSELPKYLVVEGNRRTAAFKSLLINNFDSSANKYDESIRDDVIDKSNEINVVLLKGSDEEIKDYAMRLMGIRHVSGPKQWGAYQSSRLVFDMIELGKDAKEVGELLGIRPKDIVKKYNAYCAFHQMKDDDEYGEYADTGLFSLFMDAVGTDGYFRNEWMGWNKDKHIFENDHALKRFYSAIVSNDGDKPEISNPTLFREFRKSIEIEDVRDQIMSGTRYRDVDYDFDKDKRIKRILEFHNFLSHRKFSEDEFSLLRDIAETLEGILPEGRSDA